MERQQIEALEALRTAPLFKPLPPDEQERLASLMTREVYRRDEPILRGDETRDGVFVISAGRAHHVRLTPQGDEMLLRDLRVGETFGLSFVRSEDVRGIIRAAEDGAVVYRLERDDFFDYLMSHRELAMATFEYQGRVAMQIADDLAAVTQDSVSVRVRRSLAESAAADPEHLVRTTRENLARGVRASAHQVSREITLLERRGLVKRVSRGVLHVPDVDKLNPDPE